MILFGLKPNGLIFLTGLKKRFGGLNRFGNNEVQNLERIVHACFLSSMNRLYESEFFRKIEEYVHRTFYVYDADKTAEADFASESVGGSVLFTKCTESYLDNSRWMTIFNWPVRRITVSPRVVLQSGVEPGNCWAFKGSKADLFVRLAARITPSAFSVEHIPAELSITGDIDSAPQNFTVFVSFQETSPLSPSSSLSTLP